MICPHCGKETEPEEKQIIYPVIIRGKKMSAKRITKPPIQRIEKPAGMVGGPGKWKTAPYLIVMVDEA